MNPTKDQIPQQLVGVFFIYNFFFKNISPIFVPMKRLLFILALGVMFMLGACGSKSTTNEETDVELVEGDGSVVPTDSVEEPNTDTEVVETEVVE